MLERSQKRRAAPDRQFDGGDAQRREIYARSTAFLCEQADGLIHAAALGAHELFAHATPLGECLSRKSHASRRGSCERTRHDKGARRTQPSARWHGAAYGQAQRAARRALRAPGRDQAAKHIVGPVAL